jgi:ATP/maltotriose-dependent transcriptional regulator MalT
MRLHEQAPPSADHAEARFRYASMYLFHTDGRLGDSYIALNQALEIAKVAGAADLIPSILSVLAILTFQRGQVEEGFALLRRGRVLAREAPGDGESGEWLAVTESNALLKTGQFRRAAEAALQDLQFLRSTGREASFGAAVLAANAAEAMLTRGRTTEAAALIDPLTSGAPDHGRRPVYELRVDIDLLRGDIDAASRRVEQVNALTGGMASLEQNRETAQRVAEVALWARRPGDAVHEVDRAVTMFKDPDQTIFCGPLLTAGLRACADLAEQARARCDATSAHAAESAASNLVAWASRMGGAPFTDHPFVATIPADRATWDAERTRLAGSSDPAA